MGERVIDLRSDTVTKPSAAMRSAMAAAEVGDDVYGDDPTVNRLEQRAAEIFGREAAIFVPTGTMGNQIAIRLHTKHGEEVICEARSHVLDWEMAMVAAFSGCQPRTVAAERGVMRWEQIRSAIAPKIYYRAQTGLICLENTHNMAGGTVTPLAVMEEIWAGAREAGVPVHLDGARIFNAAAALQTDVATLTRGFDTVMFCLSKGLGAPVGSMLVGSSEAIVRARVYRKALGGGMRQAGVIAAAGLIALEQMPARLPEDHANARLLAEAVAECESAEIDLAAVQTNIVIVKLQSGSASLRTGSASLRTGSASLRTGDASLRTGDALKLVADLRERGVLCSAIGPHQVRLVTHCDVSREDCVRSASLLKSLLQG
jgi:threonine aldolase